MTHYLRLGAALLCVACASVASSPPSTAARAEPADEPPSTNGLAQAGSDVDAPEISRSVGEAGGVVIFWPRIVVPAADGLRLTRGAVDDETGALALAVQEHLRAVVEQALPGAPIDVRPQPERVCPQAGCVGMTVGVVLARRQAGCAAVALISGPGRSSALLIPWAAAVRLDRERAPFREPAESEITVADFARCDSLLEAMGQHDQPVLDAIRTVGSAPSE